MITATPPPVAPRVPPLDVRRRRARRRAWALVVVVVAALGFLLAKGLAGATTYFYTADQAVHLRPQLGDTRFRIEGTVVPGSVQRSGDHVDFSIASKGVHVAVQNTGYPPQLFQPGIPVVLEGQFRGATFVSDLIMVKHTATYSAAHPQRVRHFVGKTGTGNTGTSTGTNSGAGNSGAGGP